MIHLSADGVSSDEAGMGPVFEEDEEVNSSMMMMINTLQMHCSVH